MDIIQHDTWPILKLSWYHSPWSLDRIWRRDLLPLRIESDASKFQVAFPMHVIHSVSMFLSLLQICNWKDFLQYQSHALIDLIKSILLRWGNWVFMYLWRTQVSFLYIWMFPCTSTNSYHVFLFTSMIARVLRFLHGGMI